MLADSGLALPYWGEAMMTANCTKMLTRNSFTGSISFEVFMKKEAVVSHLQAFGDIAYVYDPIQLHKTSPRARALTFVGYSSTNTKAH